MRIRIETPIAKLTADLTEEQIANVLELTLSHAIGVHTPVVPKSSNPTPIAVSAPAPAEPVPTWTPKVPDFPAKTEYRGFLYLQCEECKKFKGFMPRVPLSAYRCDCGHVTTLTDMKVMRVDCKCGAKFKYLTNTKDKLVTMDCHNCGSPVDLEYHERKQEYVTIEG